MEAQEQRQRAQRKPEEATEDYLETINLLILEKGFAASVDIAERMGVANPTVTSMINKLDDQGFLVHEKYRGLRLTEKGKKLAEKMHERHLLLTQFLMLFGVGEVNAKGDAEKIEHGLSEETLRMLDAFVQFALSNPKVLDEYRRFLRKKKNST